MSRQSNSVGFFCLNIVNPRTYMKNYSYILLLVCMFVMSSCAARNDYNVCLQFYSKRGELVKVCGMSEYGCNNSMQRYRDRKGDFPRHPNEGCFYEREE
jgi:hypothetical protein